LWPRDALLGSCGVELRPLGLEQADAFGDRGLGRAGIGWAADGPRRPTTLFGGTEPSYIADGLDGGVVDAHTTRDLVVRPCGQVLLVPVDPLLFWHPINLGAPAVVVKSSLMWAPGWHSGHVRSIWPLA